MSCTLKEKSQAFDVETSEILPMTVENGCSSETSSEQGEENHVTLVCKQDINGSCSTTSDCDNSHDKDNSTLNNGFNSKSDSGISSEQNISQNSISENTVEEECEKNNLIQNIVENQSSNVCISLAQENGIEETCNSNIKLHNFDLTDTKSIHDNESQSQISLPVNDEIKCASTSVENLNNAPIRTENLSDNTATVKHVSNLQEDINNVEISKEEQTLSNNSTATVEITKEKTENTSTNAANVEHISNHASVVEECLQTSSVTPDMLETDSNNAPDTAEASSEVKISAEQDTAIEENQKSIAEPSVVQESENKSEIGENLETKNEPKELCENIFKSSKILTRQCENKESCVSVDITNPVSENMVSENPVQIPDPEVLKNEATEVFQVKESTPAFENTTETEEKVKPIVKSNPFSISELLKTSTVEAKIITENTDVIPSPLLLDNTASISAIIEDRSAIPLNDGGCSDITENIGVVVEDNKTCDKSLNKKTTEVSTVSGCNDEKMAENHLNDKEVVASTSEIVEHTSNESPIVENTLIESQNHTVNNTIVRVDESKSNIKENVIEKTSEKVGNNSVASENKIQLKIKENSQPEQKSPQKSSHTISDILSYTNQKTEIKRQDMEDITQQNSQSEGEIEAQVNKVSDIAVVTSNQGLMSESANADEKVVETCNQNETELIHTEEKSEIPENTEIVKSVIQIASTDNCTYISEEELQNAVIRCSEIASKTEEIVENVIKTAPIDVFTENSEVQSELTTLQSIEISESADTVVFIEMCAIETTTELGDCTAQKEISLESPVKANESFESRNSLNTSGASSCEQASGADSKKSTPEKRDIRGLLNQTKPFHIPLDDKEVIEYLTQQRPRFGRPRKRKRDNTKAMQALQAMRDEGWKPGRKSHVAEDSDNEETTSETVTNDPPVKTVKRKYTKRKQADPVDMSPRKLRRVPARLANTSELRQAIEAANEEETSLEPIAHEIIDPTAHVSDTSMEITDPLALDASTEAVEIKEIVENAAEDNLDSSAVKIVDPTQFLISEPVKKKIGRPRKDANKSPIVMNIERKTRNTIDKTVTERKNSIDLNSCDSNTDKIEHIKRKYGKFKNLKFNKSSTFKNQKVSSFDLNKFNSSVDTSFKKKMGRPRKLISDVAEIVPKRKYIKKKFLNSELSPMLKKKLGRPKKLEQTKILSKIIKRQGHFKCTKKALEQLKIKPCLVMLERKTGSPKILDEEMGIKKKMGRPRKIVDENEVKEKKKMGRPRKLEGSPPTPKKPRKIKLESPDGEKIKKKQGRPRKILEDGSPREVKVSPKMSPEIKQEPVESVEGKPVLPEREMGEDVGNSRESDETKPCKIILDSSKVTKYLKTQKKRKREETHAEIIHKRFKAEMERLQNLGSDNDLVPAPSPSKSTPKSNKSHISCEICGKTFVNDNQYRLNRHMAAVHNSEPFCKRCNTMFKDRTCFYSHVKKCKSMYASLQNPTLQTTDLSPIKTSIDESPDVILPPPGELKQGLYCPYCYKTFCSKFSTERHMRIMHPDKVFCKFCLETFKDLQGYSEHLLICSERPKRDGKLQKLKNDIATKLNANMPSRKSIPNIVTKTATSYRQPQIEYESYSNEKDYGYSEFYSSSSNIDIEASSTSYSLDMSNSYSHDNSHWEHDNAKHDWDVLPSTQSQQQIQHNEISSPQQNLAMLEFMPAVNESNEFDYIHHDTIQHTEDDKVYHML